MALAIAFERSQHEAFDEHGGGVADIAARDDAVAMVAIDRFGHQPFDPRLFALAQGVPCAALEEPSGQGEAFDLRLVHHGGALAVHRQAANYC